MALRKQFAPNSKMVENVEKKDLKGFSSEELRSVAKTDSDFAKICLQKLNQIQEEMDIAKRSKASLESQLREIILKNKSLEIKCEESELEKKELTQSYNTLLKFKDKQIEEIKQNLTKAKLDECENSGLFSSYESFTDYKEQI